MKPYVRANSDYRKLELAKQGIVNAVADIERLENGREAKRNTENPRLKYEKGALCQADNDAEQWKSSGRFVWGLSSDGKKALLVGYVPQHEHGRYERTYDGLKRKAAAINDKDFLGAIEIESSEDLKRILEEEAAAELVTQKKDADWRTDLLNAYVAWHEEFSADVELANEGFEETVRAYLKEHSEIVDKSTGCITKKEMKRLESTLNFDMKFKQDMKKLHQKMKNEKAVLQENNTLKEKYPFPDNSR